MHLLALLGPQKPQWQISLPFFVIQLAKSPPFDIPEAWKRYPFWTEPLRIGHYKEYPPHPPDTEWVT